MAFIIINGQWMVKYGAILEKKNNNSKQTNCIHKLGYEFPHRKCHKRTDNSYTSYSHFLRRSIWVVFILFWLQWQKCTQNTWEREKYKEHKKCITPHCTHWPFWGIYKRRYIFGFNSYAIFYRTRISVSTRDYFSRALEMVPYLKLYDLDLQEIYAHIAWF